MIRFTGFRKFYSRRLIVSADEVEIPEGISRISGVNGSGKTTLFRCIAGMIPFLGSVRLFGVDPKKNPIAYRRLVSFSDAKPDYPGFLTGLDLLKYFCAVRNFSMNRTGALQKDFGVAEFIADKVETYSEGMHKRLSLLLAFIGSPRLIILDEPFAFLDREGQLKLLDMVNERLLREKINFLLSNHISGSFHGIGFIGEFRIENHRLLKVD